MADVTIRCRELLSTRWEVRYLGTCVGTFYTRHDARRLLSLLRTFGSEEAGSYCLVRIARYRVSR